MGGLPEDMNFALAQPLRALFEDEVGQVGLDLGLPEEVAWRQLFPSPGLAICIVGAIDAQRLASVREPDAIAHAGSSRPQVMTARFGSSRLCSARCPSRMR